MVIIVGPKESSHNLTLALRSSNYSALAEIMSAVRDALSKSIVATDSEITEYAAKYGYHSLRSTRDGMGTAFVRGATVPSAVNSICWRCRSTQTPMTEA